MSLHNNKIYKVHHLIDKNTVKGIYVFYGNNLDFPNPDVLFKTDPKNEAFIDSKTGLHLFNDSELSRILDKTNPVNVYFLKQQIHFDDSIGVIKLKIVEALSNSISLEQIYLFCNKEESFNPQNVYQTLTQKNKLELTRIRLDQFLLNIRDDTGFSLTTKLKTKETYSYDDIMELNFTDNLYQVSKPLGQKFFIIENEYPFVCNPFDVTEYDPFIERAARKSLTTLNSHLLLNSGSIIGNNIYLCLAEDVLQVAKENGVSESITSTIYYPFLLKHGVTNYEELIDKKYVLIEDNKKLLNKNTTDTFESINLFYDVHKYKKETAKYKFKGSGIQFIKLSILPEFSVKIPLDIIFKIIHATENNPLIKYNPSVKFENIYRLYADKISMDGRKIPFLEKSTIFKLMKEIGKTKTVSVYIDDPKNMFFLTCEFEESGNINITGEFAKAIDISEIEALIKSHINPIIEDVKNYLDQSGYKIQTYENIYKNNVIVKKMDYQTNFEITKTIKLDDFIGCITSAFVIETKDLKAKNGINMRFKRVSNFNKFTSQEAFIIEQANQKDGLKGDEIVLALIENYRMDENEARSLVAKLASELQVERGVKKRDIEIKSNPGFKTNIKLNNTTSVITITVENINDIYYLDTIPIYLDSFIRLTQDKNSTAVSVKMINSSCSTKEKEGLVVEDIISPLEIAFPEQEIPVVEDDDMGFEDFSEYIKGVEQVKEPKFKSAIDLIYGDDDYEDEEEDEEEKGGLNGGTSSSSEEFFEGAKLPSSSDNEPKVVVPARAPKKKLVVQEEDSIRDIVGMRLKNPTPFAAKMYELEPTLFLKEDKGKFSRYSRTCGSSAKKQPILITEEEMQEMRNEDRDKIIEKYGEEKFNALTKEKQDEIIKADSFLRPEDVIKYGSKPDNKYYYICPRYWCLKTNRPIDPKEMVEVKDKNGNPILDKNGDKVKRHPTCGGIISDEQNEIKNDGNYVYEFFDKQEHRSRDNYKQHYPNFLSKEKHPDGLCVPCCFAKWNTPGQKGRREECSQKEETREPELKESALLTAPLKKKKLLIEDVIEKPEEVVVERDNYVKGPEKFPLDSGRWGYLPTSIQYFFQESSTTCQISKTNTNLKPNHTCLLRHGVEFSEKQSFIACIADAKYYGEKATIPSILDFKEIIINSFDIDDYITYQNGNNVTSFDTHDEKTILEVDIKNYSNSKLYHKIYTGPKPHNNEEDRYFKKVVVSFENFIKYLRDDNVAIDYTYLWDIICRPNPKLFQRGINLIIMEIVNNDATNNIELICPTNHYSNEFYNPSKESLFIVKIDNLYEPIYAYNNKTSSVKVDRFFNERGKDTFSSAKDILINIIKPVMREACAPLTSMPNVYKFKEPILLQKLINLLHANDYEIEKQIMNYQGKIIGIYASKNSISGYIPCYPSAMDPTYPDYVFMNDKSIYKTYDKTVKFLTILSRDTQGEIPATPEFKVVEDEYVVGVITETNQFIQLSEPKLEAETYDDIKVLNDNNYVVNKDASPLQSSDAVILSSNKIDTERADYVKKIKLETNFYNSFRNTIRILLNDYENIKKREEIENLIKEPYILYHEKLHSIISSLKQLVSYSNSIAFAENYDYSLVDSVYTCVTSTKDKCEAKRPVCSFVKGKNCQLIIPKQNLLNSKSNETLYFGKMADELLIYSRIRTFIFQPQTYLSFGAINYNLRDDEIIVIKSLLNKDYFEGLVPVEINKYVKYNSYDVSEPKISQVYDNNVKEINWVKEEKQRNLPEKDYEADRCAPEKTHISSKLWKDNFPPKFKEQHYKKDNCGYLLISDIVYSFSQRKLNVNDIKAELIEEYSKYYATYGDQIIDILMLEGKKTQGMKVKKNTLTFPHFIYSDEYFITNLDIWIMLSRYKIPSIIIASKPIIITNKEKTNLVLYGNSKNEFAFIFAPALRAENIPKYSIIISQDGSIFNPLDVIKTQESKNEILDSISANVTLETMFKSFTKNPEKAKDKSQLKFKKVKLAIVEDSPPNVDSPHNKTKSKVVSKTTTKTKKIKNKPQD